MAKGGKGIIKGLTSETTQNLVFGLAKGAIDSLPGGPIASNLTVTALTAYRGYRNNRQISRLAQQTEQTQREVNLEEPEKPEKHETEVILDNIAEISNNVIVIHFLKFPMFFIFTFS